MTKRKSQARHSSCAILNPAMTPVDELLRHLLPALIDASHLAHEDRVWLAARHAAPVLLATTAPSDRPMRIRDVNRAYMQVLTLIEHQAPGLTRAAGLAFRLRLPLRILPGYLRRRACESLDLWKRTRLSPALAQDCPPDASLAALRAWEQRLNAAAAEGSAGLGLSAVRRMAVAKRARKWKSANLPRGREDLRELVLDTLAHDAPVTYADQPQRPKNLRWRVGRDGRFHLNEKLAVDRIAALLRRQGHVRPRADAPTDQSDNAVPDIGAEDALDAIAAAEAEAEIERLATACQGKGPASQWRRAHHVVVLERILESEAGASAASAARAGGRRAVLLQGVDD